MKLLGIDYGDVKVGIAVADTESGMSLPYEILKGQSWTNLFEELKKIIKSERIEKIIIGLPIDPKGKESMQAERVREFIGKLEQEINTPVEVLDERYSTQEAQKLSPGRHEDDVAAMLILQSYLDRNN
ncbi:MAG: Holliday junction resolvase RuvX [Patescibacteria group bacterium]|jgi:putative Holliday junction resolvase